jgi:hypothetical protein
VEEFGCGAASDSHASGTPGEDPRIHRFHRVKGGFLRVVARPGSLRVEHRSALGETVYTREFGSRA